MNVPSAKFLSNKVYIDLTSKKKSKCLINSWINSYSYQQCMRVSFISHTYRPLYLHFYHPAKCKMIFHCDLNLHFLVTNDEISLQRFSGHLDAF